MIRNRDRDGKVLLAGNADVEAYLLKRKQSNFCERLPSFFTVRKQWGFGNPSIIISQDYLTNGLRLQHLFIL